MYRKPERWVEDIRRAYNTKKKKKKKIVERDQHRNDSIFTKKEYRTGSVATNMVQNINKIVHNRAPLSAKYKDNKERR